MAQNYQIVGKSCDPVGLFLKDTEWRASAGSGWRCIIIRQEGVFIKEKMQYMYVQIYVLVQWVMIYTKCVYLFPSEAVDKTTPTVHTSPAAKTYSKSAAAPRNGNVIPASGFKNPAAQIKPSYQPGGPSGRGTHSEILPCSCSLPLLPIWFLSCVVASFSLQRAAPFFEITAAQL